MKSSEYSNAKSIMDAFKRKDIHVSRNQAETIIIYVKELLKWNRVITLISQSDKDHIIERHIINSIEMFRRIEDNAYGHIADMGSGNGFPGIMLAIFYREKQFTLIENRSKKASFLKQAIQQCSLENAEVYGANANTFDFSLTDLILARALGPIETVRGLIKSPFGGRIAIYRNNNIVLYDSKGKLCST